MYSVLIFFCQIFCYYSLFLDIINVSVGKSLQFKPCLLLLMAAGEIKGKITEKEEEMSDSFKTYVYSSVILKTFHHISFIQSTIVMHT